MFLEILLFLFLGIIIGIVFGLLPGIHPNLIVLFIPLFAALGLGHFLLLALIVSIAVTNSIVSFLPSIFLGAPDAGNELSVMPGHRMLLKGYGYQAIKLTAVGSIGAIILCAASFPGIVVLLPPLFDALTGYIYLLLIGMVAILILTEVGIRKLVSLVFFLVSGFIGLMSFKLPIDNTLLLFPIFSGFFGISSLMMQGNVIIPRQTQKELYVSKGLINRSIISGTLAGMLSGLLPGIGASQVAGLASAGKNEHAFLVTLGSITMSNIILSVLSLWLIGKSRSGMAIVIGQLMEIGMNEAIFILIISLLAGGMAIICTMILAKRSLRLLENMPYKTLSVIVFLFIIFLTYLFTGLYGMLLLATCTAIGILTNYSNVKRGILMGVLILPTIIFYLP